MSKYGRHLFVLLVGACGLVSVCVLCFGAAGPAGAVDQAVAVGRAAQIHPDWAGAVIPPNIAPLNFVVRESGSRYLVRIRSQQGRPIEVVSRSGTITIGARAWHALLDTNRGGQLDFEVFIRSGAKERAARGSASTRSIARSPARTSTII